MTLIQRSLLQQAGWRLWLAFLATLVVVGVASAAFYYTAMQRSAAAHAESLAGFYRDRLRHLDDRWEIQALQLKNQLELTKVLQSPAGLKTAAESFFTLMGEEAGFDNVHVDDGNDRLLFRRGVTLSTPPAASAVDMPTHWYRDPVTRVVHRVFSLPIWLGKQRGMGHLHWYVPIDNALLFGMATLDGELYALWQGEVAASSVGAAGATAAELADEATVVESRRLSVQRRIDWGDEAQHPVLVVRHWLARPISAVELWLASLATLVAMVLALAAVLGVWLWRTGRRMALLGDASRQFARLHALSPAVRETLALAAAETNDEILEVATAIGQLIQSVTDRERERDENEAALKETQRRLAEAHEIAGLSHWIVDLATRRMTMDEQFYRVHRIAPGSIAGDEMDVDAFRARFLPPESVAAMEGDIERCVAARDPTRNFERENPFRCGDGVMRWTKVRFRLELGADGAPRRLLGTAEDIDERKKREQERDEKAAALALAERSLTEALELAGLAYWAVDLARGCIVMNEQFYRVYRTSAQQVGGYDLPIQDYVERFLYPEDAPQVEHNIGQALADNDPARTYQDTARVCCGDGVTRWIAVRYHLELDAAGRPVRLLGTIQDVDALKRQELELRRYLDILDAARDIVSSATPDGRLFYMNQAGREMLGIPADQQDLGSIRDYRSAEMGRLILEQALPLADRHGYWEGETVFRSRGGRDIPTWQVIVAHKAASGRVLHYSTIARDLTERKSAEAELRLMATVFENSGEAIVIADAANRIVAVNAAFTRLTGYGFAEVRGRDPKLLSAGRTTKEEYQAMWRSIADHGYWRGEIWDRRKDGSVYPKWLSISAVRDEAGGIVNYIASFADITEHKQAAERIEHLAHHDPLTGLPNRFSLQGRLAQAIASAERNREMVAVMFIDLDRFKTINDTLGHHVGDELLVAVARRLQQIGRGSDIVARLGGDEFVVAVPELTAATDAVVLADKIVASLSLPHRIEGRELHATPSIGISVFPDDGNDGDTLMKNADIAMYHAKSLGRNNYQFFAASMNQAAGERLGLENQLRQAIERQEFLVHYQPQIDLSSGRVAGVEALVRWQHPEQGLMAPGRFIPILEDTGLIVQVGEWVLNAACRELKRWQALGLADVQVAVNLSARQFRQKNLAAMVDSVLHRTGIHPEQLELEITESVAMDNPQETIATLRELKRMGVMLAIDDFGTGYSSLNYLKLFPINRLKLDRSFVADIETDPNDAAICAATIALAHNLGLDVVAEGVETQAQEDYLRRLDCDIVQGYFHARPQAGDVTAAWIAARDRERAPA